MHDGVMSAQPRRRARRPPTRGRVLVAGSLAALAFAGVMLFFLVRFASRNPDQVNLGSPVFRVGRASRLAREVDERGPFLFKDPLNREREVFVQHLGEDTGAGWSAIRAYASRQTVDCLLRWEHERNRFLDPCTGQGYPPNGEGLVTYPARVEKGVVSVDLRTPSR